MAKTKVCVFCGKEYQDKLFGSSEGGLLQLGKGDTEIFLNCCNECNKKYEEKANQEGQRFSVKLANLKKATKTKPSESEIAKMFCAYLSEKTGYPDYTGEQGLPISFCFISPDGHFCMTEFCNSKSNYSAKQHLKSFDNILTYDKNHMFSAKDVSRIEYCQVGKESSGLFSTVVIYDIRLNDEKVMTYKPCIGRFYVVGKGISQVKSAEKELLRLINVFKSKVGVNLPITKVKKFK